MEQLLSYLPNINWTQPSWDVFIMLFFVVAAFMYGISLGRNRTIVMIVSIYMALAVVNTAPFFRLNSTTFTLGGSTFALQISTFLGAFVVLFFLLSRSALIASIAPTDGGSWLQGLLFSFLHIGLLISVTLSFLPQEALAQLSPSTVQFFAGDNAKFAWVIAPILAMLVIRQKKNEA